MNASVWKHKKLLKFYFHLKNNKIILKVFIEISFYVFLKIIIINKRKKIPQIILNIYFKEYIFYPRSTPSYCAFALVMFICSIHEFW